MNELFQFYRSIDDMRGYLDEYPDVRQWRIFLREKVFHLRLGKSDLTQTPLIGGFDLHEGLYSRRWIGKGSWQELLFAGPNVFVLSDTEHRNGGAPDRVICYWLSVARYTKAVVDQWIQSLPWKVQPDYPWRGSWGVGIISEIPIRWRVSSYWTVWFENNKDRLDCEG